MITALIIIGIIIVILIIIGLASGKEMIIERNITIKRSLTDVFKYLKYTRNQDRFSVWNMSDPDMKKEYKGADGNVGFVYKWDSSTNKNVGAGEQETKRIEDNKSIEFELRFSRPIQNVAKAKFVVNPVSDTETNVTWGFYGDTKFPMRIFKAMFQKMLSKDLEKSLQNLKKVMEK
jgi:hypothetical protein